MAIGVRGTRVPAVSSIGVRKAHAAGHAVEGAVKQMEDQRDSRGCGEGEGLWKTLWIKQMVFVSFWGCATVSKERS